MILRIRGRCGSAGCRRLRCAAHVRCRVRLCFRLRRSAAAAAVAWRRPVCVRGDARLVRVVRCFVLRERPRKYINFLTQAISAIMTTSVTASLGQTPLMASGTAPTTVLQPAAVQVRVDGGLPTLISQPPAAAAPGSFDARLIPEFDGTGDVVSWMTRAEMLCQLRGVAAETVIPLRLAGGAFHVWSQLPAASRCSLEAVRDALYAAFALDQYAAYEMFAARRLMPGESADVFLADLRRLAALFGGVPERALACAFVAGLPDTVRQTIRAGSKAEGLDLSTVLTRARAVISDERVSAAAAAARRTAAPAPDQLAVPPRERPPRVPRLLRCWACREPGHIAARCPRQPENGAGGGESAPPSSPARH